jgi:AcrR family transcriptional regulator
MPLQGKTKHDVLVAFRHAEILEAARRIFAEKGFAETSVDEIAHAAGVAKGTVYLYYPSKRDIYWEALKGGLVAMCETLEVQVRAAETTEGKIRAFMQTKLHFFEEHQDFFKIYHLEFANAILQPSCFERDLKEFHVRQIHLLTGALEDGVRRRLIRRLPAEDTAFAILNLTRGVIVRRLLGMAKTTIEEDLSLMFDLTWKGLAGK